jgi:ABC-2 type transport system ATP-binding protein
MHSIVFESVHKVFRPQGLSLFRRGQVETHALRDVSLSVDCGEILALLGPNGSGKSTTLKLISTVLLPDRGAVLVNGADTRARANEVRRQVGFALASERSFFPRLTARENLDFFATLENVPRVERAMRIEDTLGCVGLHEQASKLVMKFSSGMHQRLAIARAMIKRPNVLLLDEPTRSLDPAGASQFWQLLRDLALTGMTIVLATHNFSEAAVADRVAVLQRGCLLGIRRVHDAGVEGLQKYYARTTGETLAPAWMEGVPA